MVYYRAPHGLWSPTGFTQLRLVAPLIMVSDPMDAPYGTEANRVIKSRCFSFAEAPKGIWKVLHQQNVREVISTYLLFSTYFHFSHK